ncbi:hypothetical protein FB567DRAFT_6099 [Paraphoma chrysanthemicola]|uniref:Myb-like domain-containing protein n=1 Tax=Paraphoma chrysanthemicola TaxID=798071 RepID=A0A8K0RGJ0_9PLEO|nr:hypothetical protein FB567DRAFT_6099 [Paraphoma chrysanthemicola]
MFVPKVHERLPPTLLPPRHLEEIRARQDPAWHHRNATSPANIDIVRKRMAIVKPGLRDSESDHEHSLILPQSLQAGNKRIPSELQPRPRLHLARKGNYQSSVASDLDYQPKRAERVRERRKRIKHLRPQVFEGNAANGWRTEERNHRLSNALPSAKVRGNSLMRKKNQNPSPHQARSFVDLLAMSHSQTLVDQPKATTDEDRQSPTKSSHEYERFKQWTSLPSGSIAPVSVGINSGFVWSSSFEKSTTPPGYYKSSRYRELEHDSFDDFSLLPLPGLTASTTTSPINNSIDDDLQTLAKPSHEYERSRQKNLPAGSIAGRSTDIYPGYDLLSLGIREIGKVSDDSTIGSMRHQKLRNGHNFALQDQSSLYKVDERPNASSYWSIDEQQAFNQQIRRVGTNWGRLAEEMGTKTPTMIKNYYERLLASGRKDLEAATKVADEASARPDALKARSLASTSLSVDTVTPLEKVHWDQIFIPSKSGGSPFKIPTTPNGGLAKENESSANHASQKRVQYTISQDDTADKTKHCKGHFIALYQPHGGQRPRASGLSRDMKIRMTSHWVG